MLEGKKLFCFEFFVSVDLDFCFVFLGGGGGGGGVGVCLVWCCFVLSVVEDYLELYLA